MKVSLKFLIIIILVVFMINIFEGCRKPVLPVGDGELIWAKSAGGSNAGGITTLLDNSLVVTGEFIETATFGIRGYIPRQLISAGSYDVFIARYNPDGNIILVTRAGGSSFDSGGGIAALSDDSTVMTGSFSETAIFGQGEPNQKVLTSAGWDIFIARYNSDGTLAWVNQAGGPSTDWGIGVASLSDNSTVVTGYFCRTATFGEGEPNQTVLTSAGSKDIFIAQYNPDGTLAWAKRAGGSSSEVSYGITALSDNSTVVTGDFQGSATFGEGEPNQMVLISTGKDDIFIARYNPDGTLVWAKRAGGSNDESGHGVAVLSDDSTVVTGNFAETATFGEGEPNQKSLTSVGTQDIFVARYNPDGTLAWTKRAGGSFHNFGYGVIALSDNSTVVTGWFCGTATFGEGEPNQKVLTSAGSYDIFIARYNPDGTLERANRAGGPGVDRGLRITRLSDNSTVVAGYFSETATFGLGEINETQLVSAGEWDIFIARFNP